MKNERKRFDGLLSLIQVMVAMDLMILKTKKICGTNGGFSWRSKFLKLFQRDFIEYNFYNDL